MAKRIINSVYVMVIIFFIFVLLVLVLFTGRMGRNSCEAVAVTLQQSNLGASRMDPQELQCMDT